MKIESPSFLNDQMIPSKYTCDGRNINPPLIIDEVLTNVFECDKIINDILN